MSCTKFINAGSFGKKKEFIWTFFFCRSFYLSWLVSWYKVLQPVFGDTLITFKCKKVNTLIGSFLFLFQLVLTGWICALCTRFLLLTLEKNFQAKICPLRNLLNASYFHLRYQIYVPQRNTREHLLKHYHMLHCFFSPLILDFVIQTSFNVERLPINPVIFKVLVSSMN